MNLTRALDVALPEIPARTLAERYPQLDPNAAFREHFEDGKPVIRVYLPSTKLMYKFPPHEWELIRLFDGKSSYEEIAERHSQLNNIQYDAQSVRDFAAELDGIDFWYKTPQEKNIVQFQQATDQRRKKMQQRSRWADLSMVTFPAFNPDRILTETYSFTKFIFTRWFTILTLICFALTIGITVTHWSEVGRDTREFYNFSNKSWIDMLVLYVVVFGVVVIHEFAHAYASKHFGGRVTAMGFALIYLSPAVYTDTTEAEVTSTRYQRLIVTIAGVWSELIVCVIATFVWWGTTPDTPVHNAAYYTMMVTGLASILVNWNPLMKLDGYYILSDILEIVDLKEKSTAFVSAWVKKNIWGLPVEIPYVPPRRRFGYAVYALLSGAYSYTILYVVARFVGNVVRNFSPEWGFIPEIAVAMLIFRSRIRLLVNFMKFVYLDKKDRVRAWFTPRHTVAVVIIAAVFLILPLWRESASGRFMLEPVQKAVIRAKVPGMVNALYVEEGQSVTAGAVLAKLRNLPLQSEYEQADAQLTMAADHARTASLRYADLGAAQKERDHLFARVEQLSQRNQELQISSPIAGVVLTPRVRDLLGDYLTEGQEFLTVADLSALRARIYVSEYDLYKVRQGAAGTLQVDGFVTRWDARAVSIEQRPTEIDSQLIGTQTYKGMNPPHFFVVDLIVRNPNRTLKPGMIGYARVYGERRGALGLLWRSISGVLGRKLW